VSSRRVVEKKIRRLISLRSYCDPECQGLKKKEERKRKEGN
jgi:hypothetical protein